MADVLSAPTGSADALGARIREFRQLRRMSLRELGEVVQTSAGFLSQLERGSTSASISTLRRIAGALGLTVADLFQQAEHGARVLRKADRPELRAAEGVQKYLVSQRPLRHVEVYVARLAPGASTGDRALSHGNSQEVFLVTEGDLVVELSGREHRVSDGDSIEYDSSVPHRVTNQSDRPAEALWIISPPSEGRADDGDHVDPTTPGETP